MTTFRDLGDLVPDIDELDPARPDYGPQPEVEPAADDDAWTPEQGFCPKNGLLRIWVDEQVRLTRVRLSPNWRERGKGATIETLLKHAFQLANLALSRRPAPLQFPPQIPVEQARPLSPELLAEITERRAQLADRAVALAARGGGEPGRWVGDTPKGRSVNGKCTVTVSPLGQTETVEIDDHWLESATALQIADALVSAHQDAYRKLGEPRYEYGEREQVAYQMLQVQAELDAALRRGFR